MYNSETSVLFSVNFLLHSPVLLECVLSLINYQKLDPEKRAAIKLCSMCLREKQLVIIYLKSKCIWPMVKWTEGMENGGDLIQGSKEVIKLMLSILTFKLKVQK